MGETARRFRYHKDKPEGQIFDLTDEGFEALEKKGWVKTAEEVGYDLTHDANGKPILKKLNTWKTEASEEPAKTEKVRGPGRRGIGKVKKVKKSLNKIRN